MTDKNKIAHILHSVGGVDISLRLILSNIDSSKFDNIVIHGNEDNDSPYFNNVNAPIRDYKLPLQREIKIGQDLRVIIEAIKIIKKEKPDLIHAHSTKGGIIGKTVGFLLNTPVLHTPQAFSYLSAKTRTQRNFYLLIEKSLRKMNNKILASSPSERERAIKEVGYLKESALLFNNSINPIQELSTLSVEKTWPNNYICSVGRPSFQKNIELMIDVIAIIKKKKKEIHLVLMGVGYHAPNLNEVKKKIKVLNLENNITLLDWTSREDIFNIIKNSQLYVTTSRYEGLPYAVIESLALGKAIVATDADGNRDLVKNNYNGFVILNRDKLKFSEAVIKLIESKDLNKKFSKNSSNLFRDKFDISKNIENLEKIYSDNIK